MRPPPKEAPPPGVFDGPQFIGGIWGFTLYPDRTLRRRTANKQLLAVIRCVGERTHLRPAWQFETWRDDGTILSTERQHGPVMLEVALRRAEMWLILYNVDHPGNEKAAPGQEP